jgi:hypothetical protein
MDDFAAALGIKSDAKTPFDIALEKEGVLGTPKEHFIRSLYQQESTSGKNATTSNAGAVGGMQIIPDTFKSIADKNWDINNPEHNSRAGIRYASQLYDMSKGDEKAAAAGYYGGPNGLVKAQKGIAVRDPRNPNAPDTLQYGQQVADRANVMRDNSEFENALFGSKAPQEEAKIAKKEEKDKLSSFAAGFGGAISKTGGAIEQLIGKGIGLVAPETGQKIESHAQEQLRKTEEITKPFVEANPMTALAGEATGLILNPINKVIPGGAPVGMAGTLGLGAVQGAAVNALTTPVTDENKPFLTEKLKQAFTGATAGAVGAGAIKALGGLAEPVTNALGDVGKKAVQTLRDAGVPIDVAQATGSAFLNRTKAALMDNPFTAGKEEAFAGLQQAAYNKAIARTMGEDASAITPDVITNAKNRLGNIYDNLFEKHGSKISGQVYKDLAALRDDAITTLPVADSSVIKGLVDDIINKASANRSTLSGDQYQAFKRVLDRMSGQNSNTSIFAQDMKDVLLSGLKNSIKDPKDIELLKVTNKQYGNMKKIEDVVLKNVEGNVSPSLLSNSLATKAKRNAIYAEDSQLADLARAGKLVLEQKLPNSGTMARFLAQSPITAAIKAGHGKVAQMAMNNPAIAKYLEQGVSPGALRTMLQIPQMAGAYVPQYAAKPGAAGAIALRELINTRNREQQ